MLKQWIIAPPLPPEMQEQFPNIPQIVLRLLASRGLATQQSIDEFLNPDYSQDLHDPYLFKDMAVAVDRIYQAINSDEQIAVFGDYDADGVCATAVMVQTLRQLGAQSVEVYIPHRDKEGYGLNINAINYLADKGVKLIVTVDCGTTNSKEILQAQERGMEVIVTDHHLESQERPPALAILNAHLEGETYPFADLCGTGMAFKVVQALLRHKSCPLDERAREAWEKWLLDLVAIGTVTDMVPLLGENRTLVRYGLVVLRKTKRLGLLALVEAGGISLAKADPYTIGFQIGPRLNAAGRMDHATSAYILLSTNDLTEAKNLAQNLQTANTLRQTQVEDMGRQAMVQLGEAGSDQKILFAYADGWSGSLVGLVATRITQQFHRPSFALGFDGEKYVGSGRSIPSFDITKAMASFKDLLVRFGGHAGACGCVVTKENLPAFIKGMQEYAAARIKDSDMEEILSIDMEIKLADLNWEVLDQLALFEPFGQNNPRPLIVSRNLQILELQPVGKDGKHLRIHVQENGKDVYKTISFGTAQTWGVQLKLGQSIDIVYEPGINEWNGSRELQLKLVDWQLSKQ